MGKQIAVRADGVYSNVIGVEFVDWDVKIGCY